MKTVLSVNNIVKKFGDLTAVDGVSLDVHKGEIFALVGPNGSGKTTMIKIIVGLLRATSGSSSIMGSDIATDPQRAKAHVGYIPDEPNVWEHFTGIEFLHLVGTLFGLDERDRVEKIKKLLSLYQLEGIENGYFEDYSRGNKQKFTILGALLHTPELLVIDEPIVGLDPQSISLTKKVFKDYAHDGGSLFMATHMLPIASDIADRIGVLFRGKLAASGTLEELRKKAHLGNKASLEEIYLSLSNEK